MRVTSALYAMAPLDHLHRARHRVALVVEEVLPAASTKQQHKIDYLGATTLAGFATAIVLATSWGGTTYAWSSPVIIGLFASSAVLPAGFSPATVQSNSSALKALPANLSPRPAACSAKARWITSGKVTRGLS